MVVIPDSDLRLNVWKLSKNDVGCIVVLVYNIHSNSSWLCIVSSLAINNSQSLINGSLHYAAMMKVNSLKKQGWSLIEHTESCTFETSFVAIAEQVEELFLTYQPSPQLVAQFTRGLMTVQVDLGTVNKMRNNKAFGAW